jgi:predicted nucleotidyltransferase
MNDFHDDHEVSSKLDQICERLVTNFEPKSVFLYGSRARGDEIEGSDYEVGVICTEENKISLNAIKEVIRDKNFSIYPFVFEAMVADNCDIPFVKSIFRRELKLTAKTLCGEKIVENVETTPITIVDVIKSVRFNIGYALSAVLAERSGAHKLAMRQFSNSNLFAVRDYLIVTQKKFYTKYNEITEAGIKETKPGSPWGGLIQSAYDVRNKPGMVYAKLLYDNVSFLNQRVEYLLNDIYKKEGDITVLE